MKLMDKFHSPKIKRTPSKKGKQHPPEPTVKSTEKPVNKKVSRLEEQEKEVVSALRYFKTIVDKMAVDSKVLQMLPGSASKVLEAILPLVQVEARIQHSSAIASCHNRVYQSLANLIRWSDQVMLEGIDLDDKDIVTTVTAVIKAVLDGVKELVKLTIEKQEQPSPTSPSKPAPPVVKTDSECDLPLTEREKEILSKTTPIATPTDSLTDISEEEVAPPKPPLPGLKLAEHSPPALPPKKRQSASSPTRVAIVAPMSRTNCGLNLPPGALKQQQEYEVDLLHRRFSGGSQSYGGDSPRLSPCSSMGKLSKSDEQLSSLERDSGQCSRNTSCETLDNTDGYDPDYDFLHQDLSVSEPLPFPTVHSGCLSPLQESLSESPSAGPTHPRFSAPLTIQRSMDPWTPPSSVGASNGEQPPALPQKKRRSAPILSSCPLYERLPSQYDNLQEEDTPTPPFPLVMPMSPETQCNGGEAQVSDGFSDSPPPLPEKKSKTILQYMQFVEDYSEPQPSVFYQTPQSERIYEQRRNKHFQEVYGIHESYSSSDSVHEPVPPPALPPKQRQLLQRLTTTESSSPPATDPARLTSTAQRDSWITVLFESTTVTFCLGKQHHLVRAVLCLSFISYTFLQALCCRAQVLLACLADAAGWKRRDAFKYPSMEFAQARAGAGSQDLLNPLRTGPLFYWFVNQHGGTCSKVQPVLLALRAYISPSRTSSFSTRAQSRGTVTDSDYTQDHSYLCPRSVTKSESANDEGTEGEYVNLYSAAQANGDATHHSDTPQHFDDVIQDPAPHIPPSNSKEALAKDRLKSTDSGHVKEDVDELSLVDHKEIMNRITLKTEGDDGPDVRAGSSDILLVHATETDRKDWHGVTQNGSGSSSVTSPALVLVETPNESVCGGTVVTPEGLVSLHLHPYRTICRNCVRMFKLHGMDYHRTPSGTSTAPYRDVWRVGLANTAARRHTERQTSWLIDVCVADLVLYCEAFLTTYRTFITPEDLIKKLHHRYPLSAGCRRFLGCCYMVAEVSQCTYTHFCHSPDTFKKRVSKNTFFVLVRVVDELCLVELTEDILRQLMELVFRLVCNGELSLARVLRKNILDKVEQKRLLRHTHILKPLAARGVSARPGTLHDFRSHEIADQLTLLDAELFYKIEIPEVLLWAKEQNEEKSPNLTQFTEHFNNMSYWVRSIIIQQEKAQDREKLLLKFIKIMKHLRKLNNFNSYLAILSALDSAPIRRLEWQKQTSEGLEEYCTLIDSSSSFRAYRAALADVEPPCIPYLLCCGLILQDLTFVHLGNPDLIEGKVNFSKRWQQFNILDSMRRFQQVHYELKRNEDIISFFNDFSDHLAEEALWELSLKIKPRNITRRKTEREEKT
ncbi:hypothetical protein NFI96_014550 [Prochilodus magdalenae]|nr:hypothetical protein NFI96_014550 [Prochilodus magdalenae]